jgi:hypothetical protein
MEKKSTRKRNPHGKRLRRERKFTWKISPHGKGVHTGRSFIWERIPYGKGIHMERKSPWKRTLYGKGFLKELASPWNWYTYGINVQVEHQCLKGKVQGEQGEQGAVQFPPCSSWLTYRFPRDRVLHRRQIILYLPCAVLI